MVIGSGAREHAIVNSLHQSKTARKIFAVPGNPGTDAISVNLKIDIDNFKKLAEAIKSHKVDLLIVGPEIPLVNGIFDFLRKDPELSRLLIVGPSSRGALLEGSKDFSKKFMFKHNIPTAPFKTFNSNNLEEGINYLSSLSPPYVLKADGPAAGKGVLIINDLMTAQTELKSMILHSKFGDSGSNVVIEGFLDGIELSCFVLIDGIDYLILPYAKDYKRIGEGNTGLNTGGMGSISPVPFADSVFKKKIEEKVIKPTIKGIIEDKLDYVGFLFIGLIKVDNEPYVIEYNVRLGDPETQVVLPRIKNDFLELMVSTATGSLKNHTIEIDDQAYANVVLASAGYPGSYEKGKDIKGINDVVDSIVFHAGTSGNQDTLQTSGGRVLSVVSKDKDFKSALKKTYKSIEKIHFEGKTFRKDIGFDL